MAAGDGSARLGGLDVVLLDETITPAIGASAPNRDYPVSTHVRAVAAHVVFGLALGAVIETGWRLFGRSP